MGGKGSLILLMEVLLGIRLLSYTWSLLVRLFEKGENVA